MINLVIYHKIISSSIYVWSSMHEKEWKIGKKSQANERPFKFIEIVCIHFCRKSTATITNSDWTTTASHIIYPTLFSYLQLYYHISDGIQRMTTMHSNPVKVRSNQMYESIIKTRTNFIKTETKRHKAESELMKLVMAKKKSKNSKEW